MSWYAGRRRRRPGTPGEAAPLPPLPQEAPFVVLQGVRPMAALFTIQEGDTLSSIAFAYAQYG